MLIEMVLQSTYFIKQKSRSNFGRFASAVTKVTLEETQSSVWLDYTFKNFFPITSNLLFSKKNKNLLNVQQKFKY